MDLCGILYKGERKEREELSGEKRRGIIPDTLHSQHYTETLQFMNRISKMTYTKDNQNRKKNVMGSTQNPQLRLVSLMKVAGVWDPPVGIFTTTALGYSTCKCQQLPGYAFQYGSP